MTKVNLITQAEYAKHRGCSAVAVHKAVKAGRISTIDGKIDPAVADLQWERNTRARISASARAESSAGAPGGGAAQGGDSNNEYLAFRARREAAEASIAEMKEAELRGKYLVKADVAAVAFEVARAFRDGLVNCGRRLAADVAGLSKVEDCEEVIDREHRALLESMHHSLKSKLNLTDPEGGA